MRREFHPLLAGHMLFNSRIHTVVGDLGYKMFDNIQSMFPDRFHNVGAREQLAMGAAIGLAKSGKIPVFYSITPFALWRPAEWIRNYVNHENVAVKIVGGGRDKDYAHDGFTHDASDDREFLKLFPNIKGFWPETKDELPRVVREWLYHPGPAYLNLKR
jgi:transketolase